MNKSKLLGHLFAIITVVVWGSCFVLTKNLLVDYTPIQIIPLRMGLAYLTLWALRPKLLKLNWKDELLFLLIGITGGSFYFFLQNTALDHTYAANVSILVGMSPLLTVVLAALFSRRGEKLGKKVYLGAVFAVVGVVLVVLSMTLTIISGLFMSVVGMLLSRPLLKLLGTSDAMLGLASDYLIIIMLGLVGIGPVSMIRTPGAVILGMVYNYLPYMILPLYATLVKIDNRLIEAAEDLGCRPVQTFTKVILPLSMPGIVSGVTMVFVPSIIPMLNDPRTPLSNFTYPEVNKSTPSSLISAKA